MVNQNNIFLDGEGDEWFQRNSAKLSNHEVKSIDIVAIENTLLPFKNQISSLLEIGCANAFKLESLASSFGAIGSGVDPSSLAISNAKARDGACLGSLKVGVADNLDFPSNSFDIVIFGFCLYLQDRKSLDAALNEADRVLRSGGFLVITDFDPGMSITNEYAHKNGVKSYKQNYASYFIDELDYYLISKTSFSHASSGFDPNPDERVSTQVLYKGLSA